tara:strand:+ start:676 stop:1596 length:921 start_codon:yes stop_codon:yes gene_type:complete
MAGLNDIITNTARQETTLPSWFDTAQQKVVTDAGTALTGAPAPSATVGQNAVTSLSAPTNAFSTAAGTLQNIASGAANPWLTNATTGQVTPNTNTAMGGLFQAQNQQLQQLMPQYTAPVDANSIASGNFGSLRGDTAYNKAMGDAQANLFAQQNQAALQNQSTGVNAGIGAGNLTNQELDQYLKVGGYQQASPFTNISNYGKILGGIQAPTTVENQTQLSPLNQVGGIVAALGGGSNANLLGSIFGSGTKGQTGYNAGILGPLSDWYKGLGSGDSGGGISYDSNGAVNNSNVSPDYDAGSGYSTGV